MFQFVRHDKEVNITSTLGVICTGAKQVHPRLRVQICYSPPDRIPF
jgi:hypothetical protein